MKGTLNIKFIEMNGISPKTIELMVEEVKAASQTQKITEKIYRLREKNERLENEVVLLKKERARLKKIVESSVSIVMGTEYERANVEEKIILDQFRKQAAEVLKI